MTATRARHPSETARITVLIVDNLSHVRQGVRTLLQLAEDLKVVGEATNGLEAVQMAEQLRPDIVIMDLEMPEMDGFEATRQIKDRHLVGGVVVLTIHSGRRVRERADEAGVDAFVEKGEAIEKLVEAIWGVWRTEQPHKETTGQSMVSDNSLKTINEGNKP